MTNNTRRKIGRKRKEAIYKEIIEYLNSKEFRENDPVWQRAIEIGSSKHLPLTEAFKLAEQEFVIK